MWNFFLCLQKYELLLVAKLDWDLSAITAFDFVDHILQRIKWSRKDDMIRRHSLILLHLCYTGKYDANWLLMGFMFSQLYTDEWTRNVLVLGYDAYLYVAMLF